MRSRVPQKVFAVLPVVALCFLSSTEAIPASGQIDPEREWASFRGSPLNDASRVFETSANEKAREWTFKPAFWTWGYRPGISIWSSPSIGKVDDRVILFVGSYDKNLYALDAFTGNELWRYTTGGEISSTPALAEVRGRSLVFFGSAERLLYALDATTGAKVWAYQIADWRYTVGKAYVSSPAVFNLGERKVVLFCWWVHDPSFAQPLETTEALLLDCTDAQRIWQRPFSKSPPSSPCVAAMDGHPRIYISARDGNTYCLDGETGQPLWRYTSRGEIVSSPAYCGSPDPALVFVGSRYGDFTALDARDGSHVWDFKAGQWIDSSPAVAEMAGEAFVIFGSHDQSVYCLNARTGRLRWRFFTKGDVFSSPAIFHTGARTLAAIASGDDYLYLLDAWTGREMRRYRPGRFLWGYRIVGDSIWSSPIAASLNGQWSIFAPFYDGKVHAYTVGELGAAKHSRSLYGRIMLLKVGLTVLGTLAAIGILFRLGGREQKVSCRR